MKKVKNASRAIAVVLSIIFLLAACAQPTGVSTATQSTASSSAGTASSSASPANTNVAMTDVGTPRAETLVLCDYSGTVVDTTQLNPYIPGVVNGSYGFRQCTREPLWELDPVKGVQVPILAESMAVSTDDTYTKFTVKLRHGVKWSDGVDFTAADVVFTAQMLQKNTKLTYSSVFNSIVKSITAIDDYTIQIETMAKETRLEQRIGNTTGQANFIIAPKHIWENVDENTYKNSEAIGTGAYTLKQIDTNGNWFLYQKRPDWNCSAVGIIYGEPAPKYVLLRTYGTEEKNVMAAINNDLDILRPISIESWTVLQQKNPEATNWNKSFPYGWTEPGPSYGLMYNCAAAPLDNVNVRWALTLAFDLQNVAMSSTSGMFVSSLIQPAPVAEKVEVYEKPIENWLKTFTLSDGYNPYDGNYAVNMVAALKKQGSIQGLPEDEAGAKALFGLGWFKSDTAEAEKLLLAEGFKRDSAGKWLKPDGKPWQINLITLNTPAMLERTAFAVVDAWKKFGIDAVAQSLDATTYNDSLAKGTYDCAVAYPISSALTDTTAGISLWNSKYITPIGETTLTGYGNSGAHARWKSDTVDSIISQLQELKSDDPKSTDLQIQFYEEVLKNAVFMPMTGTYQITPIMSHYWTGWPNSDDPYMLPFTWVSDE